MGGGDLNLKKSWHPSTLRNIERVWKAEQKHEAEQQKIEQLQKELAAERARNEIRSFAEEQGVVRRKDERLDWMYQGPAALVSRDDYLMGRKIDKTFELLQKQESSSGSSKPDDVQPGSFFNSQMLAASDAPVDLAAKIREDPLFAIMKQEKEQRKNLLNNPVRMKQLQMMLKQSLTKKKNKKSKKKKSRKHKSKSSSESSSESDDEMEYTKQKERSYIEKGACYVEKSHKAQERQTASHSKRHKTDNEVSEESRRKEKHSSNRHKEDGSKLFFARERNFRNSDEQRNEYWTEHDSKHKRERARKYEAEYDRNQKTGYDRNQRDRFVDGAQRKVSKEKKMSESEKERLRQEMMENAKWRNEQRHSNVERYIKESEKEDEVGEGSASNFIRPMLSKAAERGTVENRVKQKIFTIQRKGTDMDRNFARR